MAVVSAVSFRASTTFLKVNFLRMARKMKAPKAPTAPPSVAEHQPKRMPPRTMMKRTRTGRTPSRAFSFSFMGNFSPLGPASGSRTQMMMAVAA